MRVEEKGEWVRCPWEVRLNSRERETVDETYKGITIAMERDCQSTRPFLFSFKE